jgi:hypothetical protein
MIRGNSTAFALALALLAAPGAMAQEVRYFEENGIQYRETTHVSQRPITEYKYEPRETTNYSPRYTTNMQDSVRTYQVPITEQQWVPGLQKTWNIFAPPVMSYRLMPVTRWETRTETFKVPVTKLDYVPYKQVQHHAVPNTRLAEERIVRREAVGPANGSGGGTSAIAQSPTSDPYGSTPNTSTASAPQDPYSNPAPRQGKLQ